MMEADARGISIGRRFSRKVSGPRILSWIGGESDAALQARAAPQCVLHTTKHRVPRAPSDARYIFCCV